MSEKKFEKIKAINNYVSLRVEKIKEEKEDWKKTNTGLLLPKQVSDAAPQNEKFRVNLVVDSIGKDAGDVEFKVGDMVVANDYDMQWVSDSDEEGNENIWVLVKADQIKAVLDK